MSEEAEQLEEEFEIVADGDGEPEIEVVDETPPEDRGKTLLPAEKEDLEEPDEEELQSYSDRVQKRIKDATFKFHDQRRKREAAEREKAEAVRFAQEALKKSQQLEAALYQYEAGFVDANKGRVEVELAQAQADLKTAFDVGDADKMAAAQAKIAKLAVQQDQFSRFTPREAPKEAEVYQPQSAVQPADDDLDKFNTWREQNKWFDQDDTLREFALGVHVRIAQSSPEKVGTEDYYREIEKRVKSAFPGKFQTEERPRTQSPPPVAGVTRTSADARKKTIKLTATQMKFCNTLGITPQQYVREYMKNGE
jgi:hypothetical protein